MELKDITFFFVVDSKGKPLAPTTNNRGFELLRKRKATLISKYPLVIKLNKEIENPKCNIEIGIDDGSGHVGLSITQKCKTKNKVVFKAKIEQRGDVKTLMTKRREHRRYRRYHKRYRKPRFNNRASSKKKGRIPPSIKQKKDAILRVIRQLSKWININLTTPIHLEDVAIDIRALTDAFKPYRWEYQQSNRLDENLRKAAILRDKNTCQMCQCKEGTKEVHHIRARRLHGADTISNLITLCSKCHESIKDKEPLYENFFYEKIKSIGNIRFDYATHVMQGKTYLREELSKIGVLQLTNGGDTANKRIEWNIEKSHANDAICIIGLKPDTTDIFEWTIKPIRKRNNFNKKTDFVEGSNGIIKHKDLVSYTYKDGNTYVGYVTALYPSDKKTKSDYLNFQSKEKHCKKVNAKKTKLLWSFSHLYWL